MFAHIAQSGCKNFPIIIRYIYLNLALQSKKLGQLHHNWKNASFSWAKYVFLFENSTIQTTLKFCIFEPPTIINKFISSLGKQRRSLLSFNITFMLFVVPLMSVRYVCTCSSKWLQKLSYDNRTKACRFIWAIFNALWSTIKPTNS